MRDRAAGVSVVIPAKRLSEAKSRFDLPPQLRQQVALGLLLATVASAMRANLVGEVFVITRDRRVATAAHRAGATPLVEHPPFELNAAIDQGRRTAMRRRPESPIAVLLGDLAHLDPSDLDSVVSTFRGCGHPLMVSDRGNYGTTFLIHSQQSLLPTRFGPGSAAAHRACGYAETGCELNSLRVDVDTVAEMTDETLRAVAAAGRRAMTREAVRA